MTEIEKIMKNCVLIIAYRQGRNYFFPVIEQLQQAFMIRAGGTAGTAKRIITGLVHSVCFFFCLFFLDDHRWLTFLVCQADANI